MVMFACPLAYARLCISWEPLTAYVRQRYTNHLRRELAADRPRHSPDERVHCIFYFIAPSGHSYVWRVFSICARV